MTQFFRSHGDDLGEFGQVRNFELNFALMPSEIVFSQRIIVVTKISANGALVRRFQMHLMFVPLQIAIGVISFGTQIAFPIPQFAMNEVDVVADGFAHEFFSAHVALIGEVIRVLRRVLFQKHVIRKLQSAVDADPRIGGSERIQNLKVYLGPRRLFWG